MLVAVPHSVANLRMKRHDECELEERANTELNEAKLKKEIANVDSKLNVLLDSYLEQIIDAETYKQKKTELFEKKKSLEEQINVIQLKGSTWIEPFREFIQTALQCGKIARAKNNCDELKTIAKRVGSNVFLNDRHVKVEYKRPFTRLRLQAPKRSLAAEHSQISHLVGVTRLELATLRSRTVRSTI